MEGATCKCETLRVSIRYYEFRLLILGKTIESPSIARVLILDYLWYCNFWSAVLESTLVYYFLFFISDFLTQLFSEDNRDWIASVFVNFEG